MSPRHPAAGILLKMYAVSTVLSQYTELAANSNNEQPVTTDLLSDSLTKILQWIVYCVIGQSIVVFGIAANIINIICFVQQGFKEPINVSLLGLAIADIGCLTTLVWTQISYTPAFEAADKPFDSVEIQYIASAWPHVTFTRVSSWITAFITLERCLCIILPMKVKTMITPTRAAMIIILIFTLLISSVAPVYVVNRLGLKFFPGRNQTLLGLVYTHNRDVVEKFSYAFNNACLPLLAFSVIITSTIILVIKLRQTAKWRKLSTNSPQADSVTIRNQKVSKIVVMISSLFIACFIPLSFLFIAMTLEPRLSLDGDFRNILIIVGGCILTIDSVNSSANIFIYYHMSTKYRDIFRQLFCKSGNKSSA